MPEGAPHTAVPPARGFCDGCGMPSSDAHIAARLRRIELSTRFRPLHISLLFLAEAPPAELENYFYSPAADRSTRAGLSRVLFDELMDGVGIADVTRKSEEACLAEFQRLGYFLGDCLECPVEEIVPGLREGVTRANPGELAHRYGPTIAQRVLFSYKPRHIVLLSTRTRHVIPFLRTAGLADRLLLYQNLPLHFPHPHNPAAQAQFREGLKSVLARSAARPISV